MKNAGAEHGGGHAQRFHPDEHAVGPRGQATGADERQQQRDHRDAPGVLQQIGGEADHRRVELGGDRLDQQAEADGRHQRAAAAVRAAPPGDQPAGDERAADKPEDAAKARDVVIAGEHRHEHDELGGHGECPRDAPQNAGPRTGPAKRRSVAALPDSPATPLTGMCERLYAIPAAISMSQISAWSTTATSSFSAFAVFDAPTSAPQISMSVFDETDEAVVAPAFSHRR